MSARDRFVAAAEAQLGKPVLMGAKGPDAFDCSGLVTTSLKAIGGPDLTHLENAQHLHDRTRQLSPGELPLKGDLIFYGFSATSIEHVVIYRDDGSIISADGATHLITSLAVALANPANRVRTHPSVHYRRDTPFIIVRRNTLVDALDAVEH